MAPRDGNDDPSGLLYGFHTVLEALRSQARSIQRLWLIKPDGRFFPLTRLAKERGIPFSIEPRERLDQLASDRHHQGVVAKITPKAYLEGEELLDALSESPTPALLVVLDQIQDPHNLGAVIRSVDASGAHGIIIPKHRAVGVTGGVAKASAGSLEHVQIGRVANTGKFLELCQRQGIVTVALDPEGQVPFWDTDMTGPVALVFGSEGEGIRPMVQRKCDHRVYIPMQGQINSLNVSVSVAATLFEAVRQRLAKKG